MAENLTIVSQHGCAFEGYHDWSNGVDAGGREYLAGIIDSSSEIIMMELGKPPEGGTTARIDAKLEDGIMRWRYFGLSSAYRDSADAVGDEFVQIFVIDFVPGTAADASWDDERVPKKDYLDISGVWTSDYVTYQRLYEDGRREPRGPLRNTLTLTMESDCLVSGTNKWDNGDGASGTEYMAGIMKRDGTRAATLVEIGGYYTDGRLDISFDCSLDCDVMNLHYLGRSGGKVFNQPLGGWSVDNVTSMRSMFEGASAFNQPLGDWSVDKVTDMCGMFNGAYAFNQPLGEWKLGAWCWTTQMFGAGHTSSRPVKESCCAIS